MTPKEKSKELFDKFLPLVEAFSCEGQTENAKQCALICVEQLINDSIIESIHEYWEEVKQILKEL